MSTRRRLQAGASNLSDFLAHQMQLFAQQAFQADQRKQQQGFQTNLHQGDVIKSLGDQVAAHPENFDQLSKITALDPLLKGVNLEGLRPSPDMLTRGLTTQLNTAKSPLDMPSDIGASLKALGLDAVPNLQPINTAQFGGQADYADASPMQNSLMGLRDQRTAALETEKQSGIADAGAKAEATAYGTTTGSNRAKNKNFPTELQQVADTAWTKQPIDAYAAGEEAHARDLAGVAPDVTAGKARQAGAVAGATKKAENANSEWLDPAIQKAKLEMIKQEGILKLAQQGQLEHAKQLQEATTAVAAITPQWEKIQELSGRVNTGDSANPGTYYLGKRLQGTDYQRDASQLDSLGANVSKMLANNPLFGGNRGAQSEQDSQAILNLFPSSYDSKELATRKIAEFNQKLYKGLAAMSRIQPGQSTQDQVNTFRSAIGLPPMDLQNPQGAGNTYQQKIQQLLQQQSPRP